MASRENDENPGVQTGSRTVSPEARVRSRRGFGPFVTFIEYERPGGVVATWESRRARKTVPSRSMGRGTTWWDLAARGWWIGVLFAVGSALFAVGALPGVAGAIGGRADAVTFFVGSIFFTSAGFLQYRESVDAGPSGPAQGWSRVLTWRPRQIDWLASAIQLLGTLWFNVSTADAVRLALTSPAANHRIWRPDALGSICFLIASGLAWFEVSHGWWSWSIRDLSWWITMLNLVGSIAFGASAIASRVVGPNGEVRNLEITNLGTFVGALCFLAGAILLLPERTAHSQSP